MRVLAVGLLTLTMTPASAQAPREMTGLDFAVEFRGIIGQTITVTDCHLAGTTTDFLRCETPNGAISYAIETSTVNRDDLRLAYDRCPTGSRNKPGCRFSVTGQVKRSGMPSLENAKFGPYKAGR